jgi:hypothetical protein
MSNFFNNTCKILGINSWRTSPFYPVSNGYIESWHRFLHAGLSHYINAAHTNSDKIVPFFLIAYRATPNITTEYSPFYLMHGREMTLSSNEHVKAKVDKADTSLNQRLSQLQASLKPAYKAVGRANNVAHRKNKFYYDRRAKQ